MHQITVERLDKLTAADVQDLYDATVAAIEKDGGFGWVEVPDRDVLKRYWNGVTAVPQRDLFVARLDNAIAGTAQLVRQPPNNQVQSFSAELTTFFVAPWARGYGLGTLLLEAVEKRAVDLELNVIDLSVRETQYGAIKLFKKKGYTQWGINPLYALLGDKVIPGYHFHKVLIPFSKPEPVQT